MSTFTYWNNSSIFWGADSSDWAGDTMVAVLRGKVTLEGNTDTYTELDSAGRRWVGIDNMKYFSSGTEFNKILYDISDNVRDKMLKKFPDFTSLAYLDNLGNKEKRELIKQYIDETYKELKKNKNKLLKTAKEEMGGYNSSEGYNEALCHSYKIEEVLIYNETDEYLDVSSMTDIISITPEDINFLKKNNIKYQSFDDIDDLEKVLESYQKKNKGQ
jgi:2-hydroxy-3-keto-5-methylthiopentenyl-1-phosphate phosphatase